MKSNKLKKIIAIAVVSTMVSTITPVAAYAEWVKDSQNNWSWTEDGINATGWKKIDGIWYHFDSTGKMQTGWIKGEDSKWYYLNTDGSMKTGWLKDVDAKWYNLAASGEMKIGWLKDTDGKWYFTDQSGAMQTGVIEVQGKIYVLEASGAMAVGSIKVQGETYVLDTNGAITGNKLPVPEKSFTNDGILKLNSNVSSNSEVGSTGSVNSSSSSSSSSSSHHHSSSNNSENTNTNEDFNYNQAGTYGPKSGKDTVNNVSINAKGVTLKNMHIKGNLELGEGIGEGDVILENVTVDGTTIVRGGGQNSIHFIDSVLATVIVNKNDGKIRIVVEGSSQVEEVRLESPAKLEESGLSAGATGFNDVDITENVQTGNNLQVEFVGKFDTINSRATRVRINLDESTDIEELILNAITSLLGTGKIGTAKINSGANGSSLSSRPENMVLHAHSVSLRDQSGTETQVTESYSNATSAALTDIKLDADSIKVNMSNFVAGLTSQDFNISAKLDDQDYTLQNLSYDADSERLNFSPISLEGNIGKKLKVSVTPASDKLTGTVQDDEVTIKNGFTGRITDIQAVGISGVTLQFRAGADSKNGDVLTTVVTDDDGYYTAYLVPGQYTGEISGSGVVKTYIYASSLSSRFNTNQNETAIRITGMDSVKVVLSWGERPYDEDSHLEGPTTDGNGRFHTWYGDKIYTEENGIRYADLDWDDTNSYGPETTTIYNLTDGKYRFYVHNFSGEHGGDKPLVSSGAKVEVYKGNSSTPSNTYTIPNDSSKENALFWLVFDMDVQGSGQTININEINQLREDITLKKSDTAETSYVFHEENGQITGVPAGTVADLKADLIPYDGGVLKVLAQGTYVYNAAEFDAAVELPSTVALANNQVVAVKQVDGTIKKYKITIVGQAPVLSTKLLTQESTTSSAVTLTWNKATDNTTPQNGLNYSLYMSENNSYNSIEEWESQARLLTQANDINRYEASGLNPALNYYFKLIVKDTDGNKTEYETEYKQSSTTNNIGSPVLSSDTLTQESTTSSAVRLTWDKATDDTTLQNNLKYTLYMSENNLYNMEEWKSHATLLIQDDDIDEYEVSGLNDTTYYFKLIVEDSDGNKTEYATEQMRP